MGGFVRDLLLEQPNVDVDIAVEGDGIDFAARLAAQLGGPHEGAPQVQDGRGPPAVCSSWARRATWLRPSGEPFHVDVATTRTEFYDYPAALPRVEHASIRQDLFRRDFTINAMAISLRGEDFGTVIDFFGGTARPARRHHPRASQPEFHRGSHPDIPGGAIREPLRFPYGRADQGVRQAAAWTCTWWVTFPACVCARN